MTHGEPAVVDVFDGPAAFAGDHPEVADRLPWRHDQARIRLQHPPARQDVVHDDVGGQHDRLVVGNLLVGFDESAVRSVVPERRDTADDLVVPVHHRPVGPAVPRGERHPQARVDVAQGAQMRALVDFHPREDRNRIGLGGRGKVAGRNGGGNYRAERAN